MKITALRTIVVAAPPHRNWVFVKVETDQPCLYGWGEEVESNTVEVHVHNLRKKLGAETIRTIRGVGYLVAKG